MKEATIERVIQNWNMGAMGVILKEKDAERRLLFFFDHAVGTAIVRALESLPSPRPQTHDLFAPLLSALRGTIRHVVVTEAKEGTFFAKLVLDFPGGSQDLDARPSDAITLAIKLGAPIFVSEALFAWASSAQDLSKPAHVSVLWPFSPRNG